MVRHEQVREMVQLMMRHTKTLGVRVQPVQRMCVPRRSVMTATPYGPISVKLSPYGVKPEYEDCATAARVHGVPVQTVQEGAVRAAMDFMDGGGSGMTVASEALYQRLATTIAAYPSVIVAYSGGVDSTLVAHVATQVLKERCLVVTGISPSLSGSERQLAKETAEALGFQYRCVETHELNRAGYRANAGDRCYFCKTELFERLQTLAKTEGFEAVLSGDNLDDVAPNTHRPGMRAADEWSVQKPLIDAAFTKQDVRTLAAQLGLPNARKIASPCLASRVPHGLQVDRKVLKKIEDAEAVMRRFGFDEFRVRHHGHLARLEVPQNDLSRVIEHRDALHEAIRAVGYLWVSLDLKAFRSGSLNISLNKE